MAGLKSLAKETAIYGVSSIVGRFLNYLLVPVYTIALPASSGGYGVVTNIYAWVALILVLLTCGMETGFFRFANKGQDDPMRVYSTTLVSVSIGSLVFVALGLLFLEPIAGWLEYGEHPWYIGMMMIVVAMDAIQSIPFAYLRYKKRPIKFAALKLLFIFLYMFMPATPVKFKHAFVAAMIAGTVYQIIQWFYIRFQIGMSSYSAIYGTLAALPLLLVWLLLSWSVVLWGTELCYIFRNRHFMYKNELFGDTAWMETLECALKIMKFVARVYVNGGGGPSLGMINMELKINTGKLRIVLQELVDLHILVEAKEEDDYFYYPASDLHTMSVGDIIIRFSRVDESRDEVWKKQFKETVLSGFAGDRLIEDSDGPQ